jgi:hypothetical protein
MAAIVYGVIRAAMEPSNLAIVLLASLVGLMLTFTAIHFEFDFGPGIPG